MACMGGHAEMRYLPPYSPNVNPIEPAFSKFKKLLCEGAKRQQNTLATDALVRGAQKMAAD
jgi:transposase